MKHRRRLLILLLLLMLGGLLLVPQVRWPVYGWLRGEAFYQGMPTSYWRGRIQRHLEASAAKGVEIPWIVEVIADLGISVSLENPLELPDVLRPEEAQAVPVLIELLLDEDDEVCRAVSNALIDHGMAAKPAEKAVLKLLGSPNHMRREKACQILFVIDPEESSVGPILSVVLDDPDPRLAGFAVRLLVRMGSKAKPAVPSLLKLLQTERSNVEFQVSANWPWQSIGSAVHLAILAIDPEAAAKAGLKSGFE